ncbi:hypothetical protein J3R30DRAFT_2288625 [Lentinula aciculospora]|uniref:Uncharacterized protein n=1 Tax=Lentinula aciculospora TaxID=153920 RepID=A0A9W9DF06_9AGAR|nr:hypothetical protein J3R30DRAFT_2288625 [Lentinula aciculospora]
MLFSQAACVMVLGLFSLVSAMPLSTHADIVARAPQQTTPSFSIPLVLQSKLKFFTSKAFPSTAKTIPWKMKKEKPEYPFEISFHPETSSSVPDEGIKQQVATFTKGWMKQEFEPGKVNPVISFDNDYSGDLSSPIINFKFQDLTYQAFYCAAMEVVGRHKGYVMVRGAREPVPAPYYEQDDCSTVYPRLVKKFPSAKPYRVSLES